MNTSSKAHIALVTGAGHGIGRAIALRLARDGMRIAVADINAAARMDVAREVEQGGAAALPIELDVTQPDSVQAAVATVLRQFGSIYALVNCAGVMQKSSAVVDTPLEEWSRILNVHLTGTFLCCRAVSRVLLEQEAGRIINIASLNALSPVPFSGAYNAAKAGIVGLTKTLAYELAPYHVTVNAICPGPVATESYREALVKRAALLGLSFDELLHTTSSNIPLGRIADPEDVANVVAFLTSEEAGYITGEAFAVAGGMPGGSTIAPRASNNQFESAQDYA